MDFNIYDDILVTIWITDKKLLHFKLSNLGQILHVDQARSHIDQLPHLMTHKIYINDSCIYSYVATVL